MTTTRGPVAPARRTWLVDGQARVLAAGEEVLIRRGGVVTRCAGAGVRAFLAAFLAGARDGAVTLDLAEVAAERRPGIEALLARLTEAGLLVELVEDEQAAPVPVGLWRRAGGTVARAEIARRLRERAVTVLGAGRLAELLREQCRDSGLRVTATVGEDPGGIAVVVGAQEEDPLLAEWNERALAEPRGRPWLAVLPYDGQHATVGPWIVPGESACYHCFRLRRASVFPDESIADRLAEAVLLGPAPDHSTRHPGLNLVQAGLVVDRLAERAGLESQAWQSVPGGLTTVTAGPEGVAVAHHRVLRVPRCPRCSPARGVGYPQVWFGRSVEAGR
ncbi:TOMM precursor leader peptide-binding protein [Crossiella sp. SN42]|uniref:TOMM precursor leader peptide-binding protein n=1 Tax=Crossiella sp. SN42 TaxID=2944808 RepID=UPI00207CDC65|nr:TOMM precursor leader peptide-binding protein [Crossiella sp. SN42]MCO1574613.1 TOMM precursor leader peptide-binding protein [Crossiella sp. SN42]